MAKRKTPKAKKPSKINNEDLNSLQGLVNNINRIQLQIGLLESQKHNLLHTTSKFNEVLPGASRQTIDAGPIDPGIRDKPAPAETAIYSDATMIFFNSKNIPKVNIYFKDIFPISLGGLEFMQDAGDIEYLKIDASFRFMYYEFATST